MKFKLINDDRLKTFAIVLDKGDKAMDCINSFARAHAISAAQFTAIGAFSKATLGFFKPDRKDYKKIEIEEQTEVLSLMGDITLYEEKPKVHAHVVLGKEDGTAHGGHLLEAIVNPTLEIILSESESHLKRKIHGEVGIPLINI